MNKLGHNPGGLVSAFMARHRDFKVPVKVWGKRGHDERGEVIKTSYDLV